MTQGLILAEMVNDRLQLTKPFRSTANHKIVRELFGRGEPLMSREFPAGAEMRRVYYFLVELEGVWWVNCDGKQLGPYDHRTLAIEGAKEVVGLFVDPEEQVSIIGPDDSGKVTTLWERAAPSTA